MSKVLLKPKDLSLVKPVSLDLVKKVSVKSQQIFITPDALAFACRSGDFVALASSGVLVAGGGGVTKVSLPKINLRLSYGDIARNYKIIFVSPDELENIALQSQLDVQDLAHNMFIAPKIAGKQRLHFQVDFLWSEALTQQWASNYANWICGRARAAAPEGMTWPVSIPGRLTLPMFLPSLPWKGAAIGQSFSFDFHKLPKSPERLVRVELGNNGGTYSLAEDKVDHFRAGKLVQRHSAVWSFAGPKYEQSFSSNGLSGEFSDLLGLEPKRLSVVLAAVAVGEKVTLGAEQFCLVSSDTTPLTSGERYYFRCSRLGEVIIIESYLDSRLQFRNGQATVKLVNGYPQV